MSYKFKLKVNENELQKLLTIFNKNFTGIKYHLINREENLCIFDVESKTETDELFEVLMEDFNTIQIEETIGNSLNLNTIACVEINNGNCIVLDKNLNVIKELCGEWKEKSSKILSLCDSETIFKDSREI